MDAAGLTLVVPLSHDAGTAPGTVDEIAAFVAAQPAGSELIFVNDGSADGALEAAALFLAARPELPARLIPRPHRGTGAAVRAGLEEARSELAGFCDADLATPLGDFARLVDAARRRGGVVIGSPRPATPEARGRESRARETLARAYSAGARALPMVRASESRCGVGVALTAIWRQLLPHCREDGSTWDVEALAVARALGIPITRKGVTRELDEDTSKAVQRDGLALLRALPRIVRRARAARYG